MSAQNTNRDITGLPEGWTWQTLGDVLKVRNGLAFKSADFRKNGVLVIRQSNLGGNRVSLGKAEYLPERYLADYPNFLVRKGDVLVGMSGAIGKLCVYDRDEPALQNQRTGLLQFKEESLKRWVWHYLPTLERKLLEGGKGVAVQNISASQIEALPIPIAPKNERDRIVAEIEKQFSRLDEAVANLKRVKANLKRYKAAVLKAAVEGKLTEEWRKAHLPAPKSRPGKFYTYAILCDNDSIYIGHTDNIERRWKEHREGKGADWTKEHKPVKIAHYEEYDTREEAADREKWLKTGYGRKWIKRELAAGRTRQAGDVEPASELLKRILAERRAKWNGKDKYKQPETPETTELPSLPKSWTWVRWEQIGFSQNGRAFPSKEYQLEGFKLLRPGNLHVSGKVVWNKENSRYLPESWAEGFPEFIVGPHELIMNLTAQSLKDEFLGRVCLTGPDERCLLNQRLARLAPVRVLPEFVLWVFKSHVFRRFVNDLNTGSLIQHMFTSQLGDFVLPLPPVLEQKQIVAEVEWRLSLIEELEAMALVNFQRAERLHQAILQRAFSGTLFASLPSGGTS